MAVSGKTYSKYFELGTSRYLIVIVNVLSLGKMHINLALFLFKKDHSLVIIQLSVPAIFNPSSLLQSISADTRREVACQLGVALCWFSLALG